VSGLLPFLVTGLVTGSLYGLAGLGLVLTYRTSGVFNFAHGAIACAAAFAFYSLYVEHGVAWPVAGIVTVLFFGVVVGYVLERVTRAFAGAPDAVVVVGTVGMLLATEGLLYLIYGNVTRNLPQFLPTSGFELTGVQITWAQVISILVAGLGALGLYLFLQRTRLGVSMRAVVDNPRLVSLSGAQPDRIRRAGWAIGSSTAAISGILLAPNLNLDVNLLTLLVVQAFGACAVGYFSSLPLTFAGGLLIGVVASVLTKYVTTAPWLGLAPSAPFLVLIAVLLIVPVHRLPSFGGRPLTPAEPAVHRPATLGLWALGGVALLFVPTIVDTKLPVWTTALSYVVVFGSLALLTWGSGQISLCHAAFLALGATTMSHLTDAHVPWLLALVLAGLAVVPVGALVAIPAIRLSGIYLALVTLGFGILMQNVVYPSSLMFGIELDVRVPRPQLGAFDGTDGRSLYYLVLAIVVVCVALMLAVQRGRFGRLLGALAETPTMLATHGLSVNLTRLLVFCLSAFFAGIGGALAVTQTGAASGITFGPIQSLLFLAVLGMCGTRRLLSPLLAALAFGVLPAYATDFGADRQLLVFGTAAMIAATALAKRRELRGWVSAARSTSQYRRAITTTRRPASAR
jgi:branched-subunit amino acid ABC-type transport system permease component